jgi:hypothetical protein
MLNVIFTLDYEIHGNGEGCPHALMVEPTYRMMDLFDQYGATLTIMADVAEILKFKEYKEQNGRDDYHYEAIANQLREAVCRGHDVQLHLHASYFNAQFKDGHWEQDWSEYNFASLPLERLNEIVRIGKEYLEALLRPVNPRYACRAFRAANWAVSPSRNVVRALVNNGIRIDTSVFKHGRREGIVSFDYSTAHSDLVPWPADENNICQRDERGKLLEIPIYCERRWIGAFLTANRINRALMGRAHRVLAAPLNGSQGESRRSLSRLKFFSRIPNFARRHAWKADFNQCTGQQLIKAIRRACRKSDASRQQELPFVLIGHSKLFTEGNQRSLAPFLAFVTRQRTQLRFGTFPFCYGDVHLPLGARY